LRHRTIREELPFMRLSRLAWATSYQRVFDIDPLECCEFPALPGLETDDV
jgi:hypothetical protein